MMIKNFKNLLALCLLLGVFSTSLLAQPIFDCEECFDEPFEFVCVQDSDGNTIPFPNACLAECAGFTTDDFVECDSFPGGPIGGGGTDCIECLDEPCEPVCVEDEDGNLETYPNLCFAECEGYSSDDVVECDFPGFDCFECLDEPFEAVCVEDEDGNLETYPNLCFAECEGYSSDDVVECDFPGFDCFECLDEPFEAVCVEDEDGNLETYPNLCFAECEGYSSDDVVECDFPGFDCFECLDEPIEPVCAEDEDGNVIPFPNACFAECAGFTADDFVECDSIIIGGGGTYDPPIFECEECIDEPFDPVCVEDEDGNVAIFPNLCIAECAGFDENDVVECDSLPGGGTGFDCFECLDEPIDPVCVKDEDGNLLELPNACFAECLGLETISCDSLIGGGNNDQFINISSVELYTPASDLELMQNPVSNYLRTTFNTESEATTNGIFRVLDLNGKVLTEYQVSVSKGSNYFEFDVSTLKSGIYLLNLQTGSEIHTVKFVK